MSTQLKHALRDLLFAFVAMFAVLLTHGQNPMDAVLAAVSAAVLGAINALDPNFQAYGRKAV